jgi:hypothetical protein
VELAVVIAIVGTEVPRCQPRRLSIWHKRQFSRSKRLDCLGLSPDGTYLEARVLRTLKNFKSMKSEEHLSSILPS